MAQSLVNVGEVSPHWKKYVVLWFIAVVVVYLTTGIGFWGTFFGMAGVVFGFWGLRSLWMMVAARSVEEVAIGSLGNQDEAVEIEGRARAIDEPLTAPLSGEECVAYQVTAKETRPSNTGGGE